MRPGDIFRLALQNLRRRLSRTILTAVGVLIGCTSIVVMVSIGNGLSAATEQMMQNMGDLTTVQIMGKPSGQLQQSDLAVAQAIPHVQTVIAKRSLNGSIQLTAANGRYQSGYPNVVGVDGKVLEDAGYQVSQGSMNLARSSSAIPVLIGAGAAYSFTDSARPEGQNMIDRFVMDETGNYSAENAPEPFFDPLKTTMTLRIENPRDPEGAPYTVDLQPVGILKENQGLGYETSEGVVIDEKDLDEIIRDAWRQFGENEPEKTYSQIDVKAETYDDVADVEAALSGQGYMTSSAKSLREAMDSQARTIQLILGGLGAISLFVAAIGITNTMIMSITERTREIGIMKALGCRMRDIRALFLGEAGLIGLAGGIAGVLLSFVISLGMNAMLGQTISIIPWWLALFGMAFSLVIGLVSGFFPASRAVRIPALEALRQ